MAKKRANGEATSEIVRMDAGKDGLLQTIPAEQLQAFLEEARATGIYEMYYIELATGLRRSELLGLKWQDIDWKNGIIKVRRQVARVDGQIVEAPLKTKNSYRTVTISQQAIEVLKEQKRKTNDAYVFLFQRRPYLTR